MLGIDWDFPATAANVRRFQIRKRIVIVIINTVAAAAVRFGETNVWFSFID